MKKDKSFFYSEREAARPMFEMLNLSVSVPADPLREEYVVHPFYRTSFSVLNGIPEEKIKVSEGIPSANRTVLLEQLRLALGDYRDEIRQFYDIRTSEEYGQTAPQYSLLDGLGLNHVSPLSLRGMGSLAFLQALDLAELSLQRDEMALMSCSELFSAYDAGQYEVVPKRRACAFLIRKTESSIGRHSRVLLRYGLELSFDQLEKAVSSCHMDVLYSEIPELVHSSKASLSVGGKNGFLDVFYLIKEHSRERSTWSMMAAFCSHSHYGCAYWERE